jgi:cytochrome b pre-mRNA-processing protein 3
MLKVKQLFRPRVSPRALYAGIVAAARQRNFYAEMGVADTAEGRFGMLVLHLFMVLQRLKALGLTEMAQLLVDKVFADIEDDFREQGASDQAVAKKMRRIEEIYFGSVRAYGDAVLQSDSALAEAISRNVESVGGNPHAHDLAQYCRARLRHLESLGAEDMRRGQGLFA